MNSNLKVLVGPNGAGKTFHLNKRLGEVECGLLITEDGMPQFNKYIKKVKINYDEKKYIYIDEENRGGKGHWDITDQENEEISTASQNVIKYVTDIMKRLKTIINKSKGQEKLNNMLNIFLQYNLNHISHIFLDEPENYFDEDYLKIIGRVINILLENNYCVEVATHSPRLLKILGIEIDNIFLVNSHSIKTVSTQNIITSYNDIANEIKTVAEKKGMNNDAGILYKLNLVNNIDLLNSFIEQNLKSEEFYRCLFCKKILIVEGDSDYIALNSIKNDFDKSVEIFVANGKAYIPFFAILFYSLGKEVEVMIDEDIEPDKEANTVVALTDVLKDYEEHQKIKLILNSPDLESEFDIDLEDLGRNKLGMSRNLYGRNRGWLKYMAAFIFFNREEYKNRLRDKVINSGRSDNPYEFE